MKNLQLVKSENFGDIKADIYSNGDDMFMTGAQLCDCLEEPRSTFDNRISRNQYLKESEFSVSLKMRGTDGKMYNTRVFNEDGIYEITMLSESPKAAQFRAWIRKTLKALRRGDTKLVSMTEYQQMMVQTRADNVKVRKARELAKMAEKYSGQSFAQVLDSYATKELTGEYLIPLPELPERTYTATEIGKMLGVSSQKVGILTNQHNLKTEQYGAWFNDKAKHSNKEVPAFRYYSNIIPVLERLI